MGFRSDRREIEGDIKRAFTRSMEDTVADADERAPVDKGALHASITWTWVTQAIDKLAARFGSALRYAAMRELGGTIRAVRARRLVWKGLDGRFHSAVSVTQVPGGRRGSPKHGKPYLRPAGDRFGEHMDKHLRRAA